MTESTKSDFALCVDLDGSLIRSDVLYESALALLRANPLYLFVLPIWLLKGKAYLKNAIAERAEIDVSRIPVRSDVINYIRQEHSAGTRLVLCTASHEKYAQQIAAHIGLFAEVIASNSTENLKGAAKARMLCERFGTGSFDYLGDSKADMYVWKKARHSILVGPNPGLERELTNNKIPFETIYVARPRAADFLRALRPHQWVKNLLLFIPLLAAHRVTEPTLLIHNLLAFVAFCMAASSTYLVNDLFDLQADRQHPTKCTRPFASGSIPLTFGLVAVPLLFLASLVIALWLPREFMIMLLLYYVTTVAYSMVLKKIVIVDVMILAGFYTLRLLAGGAATSITPTFWLLAFAMFLFLSLAIAKRNAELLAIQAAGEQLVKRRQYEVTDIPAMMMLGTSSGLIAVLVLALYVNSEQVHLQYPHPEIVWLLCPLMLFWVARLWLKTSRGELDEDPVIFALRDRTSQIVGLLCLLVIGFAIW